MKPYFLLVQSLQALLTHTLTFAENVKNNFKEAKTGELLAHNICERKKNLTGFFGVWGCFCKCKFLVCKCK